MDNEPAVWLSREECVIWKLFTLSFEDWARMTDPLKLNFSSEVPDFGNIKVIYVRNLKCRKTQRFISKPIDSI